ncbi:alpha/beta hydrolase [Candidatus Puniceispirillum sp.]|nr:alpha/beta hydrolase [Candidatus Puniceispirillum sp.]
MQPYTPIFIPGLLCNELLFAKQRAALPQKSQIFDTSRHGSITEMAKAALNECEGLLVPIGLSMGGYVALEIARIAPDRVAGMALLSTNAREDSEGSRMQRLQAIELAKYNGFQGVTRHLMPRLLSKTALADDSLVNDVLAMAADIGRLGFVKQQTAILGRRDQADTLVDFTAPLLVLCGTQDVLTPPPLSAEMANLATDSALCLLDNVGHLSSLEAPEAVTAALQELFKRIG